MDIRRYASIAALALLFGGVGANAQKRPYLQCSERLEDPYGLTSEITRVSGEFERREEALDLMGKLGTTTLRLPMNWDNFVAPNGSFVYKIYDPALESLKGSGMCALGVINHFWSKERDAWKTPGEFAAYVREVMYRYRFYISDWEIVPGPDGLYTGGSPLTAAQYFSSLKGVYKVAKAIKPEGRVVLGAPNSLSSRMLDTLFTYGAQKYFDVMSFSGYGFPEDIARDALKLRRIMYKGGWSKPVWLTNLYYGSYSPDASSDGFWREVVSAAAGKLGIKTKKTTVAVVISKSGKGCDALTAYEIERYLKGNFKNVLLVGVDEIPKLQPSKVQFLVPGKDALREDVARYVKAGGTIILENPRWPEITHVDILRSASREARELGAPAVPDRMMAAKGFSFSYRWDFSARNSARYLTDGNLEEGDEMIPLLLAGDGDFEGVVAAIYKIRSGGSKGNAIIQSRKDVSIFIDQEQEQARRLCKTFILAFACGVDKVFWNGMRSKEKDPSLKRDFSGLYHKDLSPKPAASAYRTLTTMLPPGSIRPSYECNGKLYLAHWTTVEGTKVWAVWCDGGKMPVSALEIRGKGAFMDCLGHKMKTFDEISDAPVYITGATNVEINH